MILINIWYKVIVLGIHINMKRSVLKSVLFSFLPVVIVALLGSVFVGLGMEWFSELIKPSRWIPNIVIPIVWTIIYLLSATVLFLWQRNGKIPTEVWVLYVINGVLNILWCLLFFALNLTLVGLIVIILNLIFGYYLLLKIRGENLFYYMLSFIYPVWLSVATCLNIAIWILN